MSYTNGLTYKPRMDRNIADLLENGALVHMLEFTQNEDRIALKKDSTNNYIMNLANGLAGESTGLASRFKKWNSYDTERGEFTGISASSVKTGYPFKLFQNYTNVGLLLDPADVSFIFIGGADVFSHEHDQQRVLIGKDKFEGEMGRRLLELNTGDTKQHPDFGGIFIPHIRAPEEEKALRKFFYDNLFGAYANGLEPADKGFLSAFKTVVNAAKDTGLSQMNEIGINLKPQGVKAIVIYNDPTSTASQGYKSDDEYLGVSGGNLAYLLNELIKEKTGKSLPVIHYNLKDVWQPPAINQVTLEPKKVAASIEKSKLIRDTYELNLGKERTEDLILGRITAQVEL